MNNRQVAHVWAQQNRESGKGSSFYFEGPTIFSYGAHFPIARFTKDAHGKPCVLFTTRGYSNSTSKHINYTRFALQGLDHVIFYVRNPDQTPCLEDAKYFLREMEQAVKNASRARTNKERYLREAASNERQFFDLCRAFKIKHKDARKKTLLGPDHVKKIEASAKAEAEAKRKAAEEQKKEAEALRAEWKAGEKESLPYYAQEPVLLRIKGEEVETSRGACVPLKDARFLYEASKLRGVPAVVETRPMIGHFQISRQENGDIVIGCHRVSYAEIVRVLA